MHEVKTLAARHNSLDFTFVDNMLPTKESLLFLKMTGEYSSDYNFFAELRSAKEAQSLTDIFFTYRQGGLTTIQVGIEALSSSLLEKMQKGISVIENIATMRAAQENCLRLEGNLIMHFPIFSVEIRYQYETSTAIFTKVSCIQIVNRWMLCWEHRFNMG